MSSAYDYRRVESDSAFALAFRMAGYVKDAEYIARYVSLEYGKRHAPSASTVRQMQEAHRRQREAFRLEAEKAKGYNPDNDNGEPFKPASLVRPEAKPVRIVRPNIAALERGRETQATLRNAKAIKAGPIARSILARVAKWFNLTVDDILGGGRREYVVSARFVAIRLIAEVRDSQGNERFSKSQIGRIIGGRDHSTILHALDIFDDRARKYTEMTEAYEALR